MTENTFQTRKNILISIDESNQDQQLEYIKSNFCGQVISNYDAANEDDDIVFYLCGDIEKIIKMKMNFSERSSILIIKEYSSNYQSDLELIDIGQVPINLHNVGVLFRRFFNSRKDHFKALTSEHQFQLLTESNKPSFSLRKGIYLTNVEQEGDETKFNLLRCSTNLKGPTENFRQTDREIVNGVNQVARHFYQQPVNLNHVLAQVYNNEQASHSSKERKAKIKQHSDKTKDMPRNALMAFVTFYDFSELEMNNKNFYRNHSSPDDPFDLCYKHTTSILTKLHFKLKDPVKYPTHQEKFDVTLYPNSVFLMSLETNRLYTHEIKPSGLPVDKLPTRIGYVIRCSTTQAVHKDGQTYILEEEKEIKLEDITQEDVVKIKELYLKENRTDEMVTYKNIYTSMNRGDYLQPIV